MDILKTIIRLLTFRISREEMLGFGRRHFIAGFVGTCLVGIGRYWDDPGAKLLQHLGLGSVIYIFCLSAFIWLIILPFKVENWSYSRVLTFVSLTSFPAILYAIPVERFLSQAAASQLNVLFLACVAAWRLCLLFMFMSRFCQFSSLLVFAVAILPVCLIVNILSVLNLERAVFEIMGGLRENTANDNAYAVLLAITVISYILLLPVLAVYVYEIIARQRIRNKKKKKKL
ncbi:MAG TPA: hypothetical protein VIZ28_16620 [Chitinophagaceae bacterium]